MRIIAAGAGSRSVWRAPRVSRSVSFVLAVLALSAFCHSTVCASPSLSAQIAGTVVDQTRSNVNSAWVVSFGAAGFETQRALTDETLAQVQLRILGPSLQPNTLFNKNPGFALLNLRSGFRIGERSSVTVILENIFDKNYRTMGSGIDGPGINAAVRYSFRF